MNIRHLAIFIRVAETGSISRAAVELGMDQPAVSRCVLSLEASLGVSLLNRLARGVHVTDAGRLLSAGGEQLLRGLEVLEAAVRTDSLDPSGRLKVGMPPSLSHLLTARVLSNFCRRFPRVLIYTHEANSSELFKHLQADELDLAVIVSTEPEHDVVVHPLINEPITLVCPLDSPHSTRGEIDPAEIVDLPLILLPPTYALRRFFERKLFARLKMVPSVVAESNSLLAVLMVQAGIGYSVLPASAAWSASQQRLVAAVPVRGLRVTWVVAHRKSRPLSTAGMEFVGVLREQIKALVDGGYWDGIAPPRQVGLAQRSL